MGSLRARGPPSAAPSPIKAATRRHNSAPRNSSKARLGSLYLQWDLKLMLIEDHLDGDVQSTYEESTVARTDAPGAVVTSTPSPALHLPDPEIQPLVGRCDMA
ncbi:hypothetical protein CLCR_06464 [Cladophialophora carrionii]|uniref:Uncharacterized protein n=1 Tax=Cladophialophora carrionii TaxID=86049 RepID=A0A1C1C9D8_9EURO|nr:hypothetical protein CLCR_06464 [Cladophialophora carrionii]